MSKRLRRMRKWISALRRDRGRGGSGRPWRAWYRAMADLRLADLWHLATHPPGDDWDWMQDFERAVSVRMLFPYTGFELHRGLA